MSVARVVGVGLAAIALSALVQSNELSDYHQNRLRFGVVVGCVVGLSIVWFGDRLADVLEAEREFIPAPILKALGLCILALTIAGAYARLRYFG